MTNAELIAELRGHILSVPLTLLHDAADALEAAERLLDQNTKRCEALRKQLRESHENYEKHINELEARLPKRGKWVDYMNSGCKCSVCNSDWGYFTNDTERFNYCPNCGAKMRKGEQE